VLVELLPVPATIEKRKIPNIRYMVGDYLGWGVGCYRLRFALLTSCTVFPRLEALLNSAITYVACSQVM